MGETLKTTTMAFVPDSRMQLTPRTWVGWQVLDGQSSAGPPWDASPIFITAVTPLKTGNCDLAIDFIAVLRPLQPTKASATFRIQRHSVTIIVGVWREGGTECVVAITKVTMDWLLQYCAPLLQGRPPYALIDHGQCETGNDYLDLLFGRDEVCVLAPPAIGQFLDKPEAVPTLIKQNELHHRYEGLDAWLLMRGLAPAAMEQKWCVRTETRADGHVLAIYRSWTGFPVWKWAYQRTGTGVEFSTVEIGTHPEYYKPLPWPKERKYLLAVVEDVLLGRPALIGAFNAD